jgi:hypothetical protein
MNKTVFALALASFLVGCGGGGGPTPTEPVAVVPEVISGCATPNTNGQYNGTDYTKRLGNYTLSTNSWGKQFLTGWTDCLTSAALTTNGVTAEFNYDWPDLSPAPNGIKAFTNIIFTPDNGKFNPIQINQLGSLTLNHDVELAGTQKTQTFYNLFADPSPIEHPQIPSLVELGINLHPLNHGGPFNVIDTITVNGNTYWVEHWEDVTGGYRHISIAFESQNKILKASIPLKPFFDYIINRGLLPAEYYLHSIQLGTEVFDGKGTFKVKEFSVTK